MNTSDSKYKAIAALEQFIREGRPVKFPVKGTSMLPFIVGDRDCVEFYPVEGELKVGDIVRVKILSVDTAKKRIALTMKGLQ